ncbi:hypothetical protein F4777DRAFT_578282 [Nemania sp. FL0916]|nr:hypothetical protein F4777DRAFT_578282 [Nemania sp. FL0916]
MPYKIPPATSPRRPKPSGPAHPPEYTDTLFRPYPYKYFTRLGAAARNQGGEQYYAAEQEFTEQDTTEQDVTDQGATERDATGQDTAEEVAGGQGAGEQDVVEDTAGCNPVDTPSNIAVDTAGATACFDAGEILPNGTLIKDNVDGHDDTTAVVQDTEEYITTQEGDSEGTFVAVVADTKATATSKAPDTNKDNTDSERRATGKRPATRSEKQKVRWSLPGDPIPDPEPQSYKKRGKALRNSSEGHKGYEANMERQRKVSRKKRKHEEEAGSQTKAKAKKRKLDVEEAEPQSKVEGKKSKEPRYPLMPPLSYYAESQPKVEGKKSKEPRYPLMPPPSHYHAERSCKMD